MNVDGLNVGTLVWLMTVLDVALTLPSTVRIAGLFEPKYQGQKMAFQQAVDRINKRYDILPHTTLVPEVREVDEDDSFHASKEFCHLMKGGIAAIFGPMSSISAAHVQSVCEVMEIPHVETRWDFREQSEFRSINLYPHYSALSKAYIDIIKQLGWTSCTILYEGNDGLIRLQELLRAPSESQLSITVRKIDTAFTRPDSKPDYRPILKEIKKRAESRIVIDCDYTKVQDILKQAQQINMMTQYYHYLLTTLDLDLVDLNDFRYGGTNITAFRLVDPSRPQVQAVLPAWKRRNLIPSMQSIQTETALMYDAVHLFAKALHSLSAASDVRTKSLSCSKAQPWAHGNSLLNYMKITDIDGLSGSVVYDNNGQRSNFQLDVTELGTGGLEKIGRWDPKKGVNITKDYNKVKQQVKHSLKNKTLIVTTVLEPPYAMAKEDPDGILQGNDRFEGYCIDLLENIANHLKFNYTIIPVADGQYGAQNKDGEWSGVVRELIDRKADLAVASLTITYLREQFIDFTKPYMNLGISILYKKPMKKNPELFSFLAPLSVEIWLYMIAAYLGVSFMLFILARFSPYEWYNPHPCNPESDVVENQFTLLNSLWFTIGSLMQQGSDIVPNATSTRVLSAVWYFFTLIIISSYTANLAAFLTVEKMNSPIENADDLSKQTAIPYGTSMGGSTENFFKTSKIQTYERMWNFMESATPSVFTATVPEGIERVKKEKYAFLVESTTNEYTTQRNCELMQVGGLLDSKGYGIGTPRDSPYRDLISNAILKLAEEQKLQILYNRWWKEKGGGGKCDTEDNKKTNANELGPKNVGGVFVVLAGGLGLAIIAALFEFIWKSRKYAKEEKAWGYKQKSLCSEITSELRLAVKCNGGSSRPSRKRRKEIEAEEMNNIETNGLTMMPLTGNYAPAGYPLPPSSKDQYS
ncbi:unnamed protein product [Owenia fusiformis]|uniref:Uncharacterized protein n=1 Tax=Owenia fusiformis TaxID=6347 RepID=A0A8J1TAF9_OWEFU|nr:unnamed protein product [Owenia fusiformis]